MSSYLSIPDLKIGAKALVTKINTNDEGIIRHLMALGILQGVTIMLERRFPSYVIKVGRSRVALDETTAQNILVNQDFHHDHL